MHVANSFLTLTYSDKHLPADLSLDLKHWQDFAKRLRQHYCRLMKKAGLKPPYKPFRFYMCGEYGEGKGERAINPHYHALIFGQDFTEDRKHYKFTPRGDRLYTSELLDRIWGKGDVRIGAMSLESAHYVSRYAMTKQYGDRAAAHYEGRKPEFSTMSRRPGIGKPWLDKFESDVYPHDYVVGQDGKKTRPPRYFDTQITDDQLEEVKAKRKTQALKHRANNTPERLCVRETVLKSRLNTLSRTL